MIKMINSFKHAIDGILSSFKSEQNMKIHLLVMTLVIICGFIFKINMWEWIALIIVFILVIGAELFNTALETTIDMVMPKYNEKAKLAKDISAGAVLLMAIGAIVIGIMIFLPKILDLLNRL